MAQRVHIRSCFLEETTVGNNNKMTVNPGAADPRGVARAGEPGGSTGEPGTPRVSYFPLSFIHLFNSHEPPISGVWETGEGRSRSGGSRVERVGST